MPRIQLRRDTAANWTSANPTLAAGEMGVETDTRRIKIGTGSAAWTALAYLDAGPPQVVATGGGAIADLTSGQQAVITTGTVVTTTDGRRWIYSGTGSKTSEASYIELADVTPTWDAIASKPSTFPPETHTHTVSDVTDFPAIPDQLWELSDVADFVSGASPGHLLTYSGSGAGSGEWVLTPSDLSTTGVLKWDAASSGWSIESGGAGGGWSGSELWHLDDVDYTVSGASGGQMLAYNASAQNWQLVPSEFGSGGALTWDAVSGAWYLNSGGGGGGALWELSDVNNQVSGASNGQFIYYSGSGGSGEWVLTPPTLSGSGALYWDGNGWYINTNTSGGGGGGSLWELLDVGDSVSGASGHLLYHNGNEWQLTPSDLSSGGALTWDSGSYIWKISVGISTSFSITDSNSTTHNFTFTDGILTSYYT